MGRQVSVSAVEMLAFFGALFGVEMIMSDVILSAESAKQSRQDIQL